MATEFVYGNHQDNNLTPEGEQVLKWLESYLQQWEERVGAGDLPGHIGHYYVNVMKMKTIAPKQWLLEQSDAAEAVLGTIHFQEAKQAETVKINGTAEGQTKLEKELVAFKEEIGKRMADLEAENQRLREITAKPVEVKKNDAPDGLENKAK